MRIVHAASSYPLAENDSTAPFMEEMLSALATRGHDVTAIVPRVRGLVEGERSRVRVVGVPYAPPPFQVWGYGRSLRPDGGLRHGAALITPVALASMAQVLRATFRTEAPDVVHLHWVLPQGQLAFVLPRSTPIVVSAHGADARFARGRLRPVARRVLDRADAVVAASSQILDSLAALMPGVMEKSHVIPHGANDRLLTGRSRSQARALLGIEPSTQVVLGVGRLVPKKGFDRLVGSVVHLEADTTEIFIIGEGPDRSRLESLIPPSLGARVHLLGLRGREEVANWYSAADVVAVPSLTVSGDLDSGPVVLMEALAAGRAVVTTPVGMAPDLIREGINGLLVGEPTPAELARVIDAALGDSVALGIEARRTFEEVGDWNRVASQLESVYEAAIRRRSSEKPRSTA